MSPWPSSLPHLSTSQRMSALMMRKNNLDLAKALGAEHRLREVNSNGLCTAWTVFRNEPERAAGCAVRGRHLENLQIPSGPQLIR